MVTSTHSPLHSFCFQFLSASSPSSLGILGTTQNQLSRLALLMSLVLNHLSWPSSTFLCLAVRACALRCPSWAHCYNKTCPSSCTCSVILHTEAVAWCRLEWRYLPYWLQPLSRTSELEPHNFRVTPKVSGGIAKINIVVPVSGNIALWENATSGV